MTLGEFSEVGHRAKAAGHSPAEYNGHLICTVCDVILCPANQDDGCLKVSRAGARRYLDELQQAKNTSEWHEHNRRLRAENARLIHYQDAAHKLGEEASQLRTLLASAREVLELIKFSRGSDAGSVNAANYTTARTALAAIDASGLLKGEKK